MTSEVPQPFDQEKLTNNPDNPQKFFLPPTNAESGVKLLDQILEKNKFSNEEMFEAISNAVCLLSTPEEGNLDQKDANRLSQLEIEPLTTLGKFSESQLYGFPGFDREIGLERTNQTDEIEREEHAHILIGLEEDTDTVKSIYYELDRNIDGFVFAYKTVYIWQKDKAEDEELPNRIPPWEMPKDEKRQLVQRLQEYLKYDPRAQYLT